MPPKDKTPVSKPSFWSKVKKFLSNMFTKLGQYITKFLHRAYFLNNGIMVPVGVAAGVSVLLKVIPFFVAAIAGAGISLVAGGLIVTFIVLTIMKLYEFSLLMKYGKTIKSEYGNTYNYVADTFGDFTLGLFIAFCVLV